MLALGEEMRLFPDILAACVLPAARGTFWYSLFYHWCLFCNWYYWYAGIILIVVVGETLSILLLLFYSVVYYDSCYSDIGVQTIRWGLHYLIWYFTCPVIVHCGIDVLICWWAQRLTLSIGVWTLLYHAKFWQGPEQLCTSACCLVVLFHWLHATTHTYLSIYRMWLLMNGRYCVQVWILLLVLVGGDYGYSTWWHCSLFQDC